VKRSMLVLLSLCLGLTLLGAGAGHAAQDEGYPIGFVLDLTGRTSTIGVAEKNSMEIAIKAINEAGGVNGRKLVPVLYDAGSDTAKAVLHTNRLIDVDKVVICAGYSSSGTSLASIPIAESKKTPLFSAGASQKIWIPTKKWAFNVVPRQLEASIPTLIENLTERGCKKIAYIYIDNVYGQTGKMTFDEACKNMNVTPVIVEKYAPGSADVGPQITHIKAAGTDGILITGQVADTVMVIKNARDMGFTDPIVSDYAIVGPEFIDLAGKYGDGIVTTTLKTLVAEDLPANDPQKKVCMDLYTAYTKDYGPFSLYAGHTWDEIYMIAEALKKVDPKLDPAKSKDLETIRTQLRDNIEAIQGFVGQNGIFNYTPDNHNGLGPKCYVPVQVQDGKWILFKK